LTHEQFQREKNYRVSLSITKAMLSKGVITEKDYMKIDRLLITRYKPVIGAL